MENPVDPDLELGSAIDTATETITVSGRLICDSGQQADRVREYLPDHIRLTRAEPGCEMFEVTETDDPLIWHVKERFTDQAAFEDHQARTRNSEWARQTADIERDFNIFRET